MSAKVLKKIMATFIALFIIIFLIIFLTTENLGKNISLFAIVILVITEILLFIQKPEVKRSITSKYVEKMESTPWQEYPRPQLKRSSYICLNGKWDFAIKSKKEEQPTIYSDSILVPFPIESQLSKVEKKLSKKERNKKVFYYQKKVLISSDFIKKRIILHFGAVNQNVKVYVNGHFLHESNNGYLPFKLDITDVVIRDEENTIVLAVVNKVSTQYPYGKQKIKNTGMWYTPISGIWQTVWLESVEDNFITNIGYEPNIHDKTIKIIIGEAKYSSNKKITITTPNGEIVTSSKEKEVVVKLDDCHLWSPEDPYLYYLTVSSETDYVESYFAMREFSIIEVDDCRRLALNGKPYFFNGLLDQGYYSDGLYTPPTIKVFEDELQKVKDLGFNTIRKHLKVEPLIWYHLCDKMGIIVFQDIVNNSKVHYILDCVLPNLGFVKRKDTKTFIPKKNREAFTENMLNTVEYLKNVPSIALWTIFNEGFGQFESAKMYHLLKEIDSSRFIDSTSGWFDQGVSDVKSIHTYFKAPVIKKDARPIVISEFGGLGYRVLGHVYNTTNQYSYGSCQTIEELNEKYRSIYENTIIANINQGLSASIYTQLSDVEDELNGLFTYDRFTFKLDARIVKEINQKINKYYEELKEEKNE